jgi:glutathione S-transferase
MIKYRLFHAAALRSVRVRWLLHELVGDDFTLRYVDVYGGEQHSAEYLAINPNHAVPTLQITLENGKSINMIESAAMIALLADAYPEKRLAPPAGRLSLERADYLQILHFSATMDWILWQIRAHDSILPESESDSRTSRRYRTKFSKEIEPQLRTRFERAPFICGDEFRATDCIVGHVVMWAKTYGLCSDERFDGYLARLAQRPAYVSAFSDLDRFSPNMPRDSPLKALFTG